MPFHDGWLPTRTQLEKSAPHLGPVAVAGHVLTVWGLALSNALLGLALLWTGLQHRRLRWRWRWTAPLLVPLGLYAIAFTVSVISSLDPAVSARELKSLLGLATLPLAILWIRGQQQVRRVFDLILWMMVILAGYGIGQYFLTDYGPLDNRIPGPFSHYMTFAGVLLIGVFLLVGRIVTRDGWKRPGNWLALALISTTLVLTLTRGAWIAAAVVCSGVLLRRRHRFRPALLALVAAGAILFVSFGPETWKSRVASIADPRDESNYDRLSMLQAGFFMISERPLFGIGPGMVKERYPIYRHPTAPRFKASHLHNTFLQIAAERGLLSLGLYLWLMVAGLTLARRAYRREGGSDGEHADLYLGAALALVGFNLAGLFEANWRDTEIQRLILFLLAVPICLRSADDASRPEP